MSRGKSIFLIFQLFCFATFLVLVSIRFAISSSTKFFTFTSPMTPLCSADFFGASFVVWSKLSWPFIVLNISFASLAFFVIGPMQSKLILKFRRPHLETLPYVGFRPVTPQWEAGFLIEPPVSEPSVKSARSAATAEAGPEDEPPGISFGLVGFLHGPKAEVSPEAPHANSSMFSIPKSIASSASSLFTVVALKGPV